MRVHTDLNQLPVFRNAVVTIGSFDGVHAGHQQILRQLQLRAKHEGGESIVVTFDPHPRTVIGKPDPSFRLITNTREKTALFRQYSIDHLVIVPFTPAFAAQSAEAYIRHFLIQYFQPKCLVIGYDHRFGAGREGDIDYLKRFLSTCPPENRFAVEEIAATLIDAIAVSSTQIRKALDAADLRSANHLLGHPFSLSGLVVQGDQIGRSIGFPTANIRIDDPYKLIPPNGIYAAQAHTEAAGTYDAMLYIGDRPTVSADHVRKIEVNLLDFSGDLYGQLLTVSVLDFIRPDRHLNSLEALQQQISADQETIRTRLALIGSAVQATQH